MTFDDVQRYARQLALPEIRPDGQARLRAARVLVAGGAAAKTATKTATETAALYLTAAGIGQVVTADELPADGDEWLAVLEGIDLVVRVGFDDDALLGAAKRRGVPVVVVRATPAQIDVVSFPRRAPDPEAALEVPSQAAAPTTPGAADVLAGTLAAAEALVRLAGVDGDIGRTRHLRLPLDGGAPVAQQIP